VEEVLYTDISRDGMMSGPDLRSIERLADEGLKVYASGGIASVEDVKALKALGNPNVVGVIVGKALYEGKVSLEEMIRAGES